MSTSSTVRGAHLVGSVPLDDADEVFRAVDEHLGGHVRRVPDGARRAHAPSGSPGRSRSSGSTRTSKSSRWTPRSTGRCPALASATASTPRPSPSASSATHGRRRRRGRACRPCRPTASCATPRFQVSLPTPIAPVAQFVTPEQMAAIEPAYEAAMLRELGEIAAAVPHDRLAIQWDTAIEFAMLEGVFPTWIDPLEAGLVERLVRLGDAVPADVELGYHLCYGDAGHEHFVQPADTGRLVTIARAVTAGLEHPRRLDPHAGARGAATTQRTSRRWATSTCPRAARLHLGLVHATDGAEGARGRIDAAASVVDAFGVATECGFGRRDPATVAGLLELHAQVASPLAG